MLELTPPMGDVILTGTPEGVGPIQPGDSITVDMQGLLNVTIAEITER